MRKYLFPVVVLLLMLWLTAAGSPPSPLVASPPESPLFTPVAATQRTPSAGPEVIRARFVAVDMALLTPTAETFSVNPFAGLEWTAVRDSIERHPLYPNSFSWQGHLEGVPLSQATFTVHEGIVVGKIAMPGGVYELRHNAGTTEIVHLNQTAFVDHGQALIGVEPGNIRAPQAPQATADNGSTIDIMVLYTPQARLGAGGTSAIQATIQLAVAETNQAYANSGVNHRMALVHTAEVTYNETTDGGTELGRLRDPGDGFMDEIHGWRNTYHADFVALIVEQMLYQSVSVCGLGYRPNALNDVNFEYSAFSVTARGCATGNYTFGHEVGHNMGLNHDWYADGNQPPVPQAHGYAHPSANPSERWRTVMAYNNLCAANGGSCARLLYFSNPNQTYTGAPMGVAVGTASNCVAGSMSPDPRSCDADNRSVLNANALNNAQYRRSAITWTGATNTDWNNPANWTMQEGPYDGLSLVNRVPRAIDDVVIPANPTAGRFPILSSGTAVVRHLNILPGGLLTLAGGTLVVEGEVTNHGTLRQTQAVPAATNVQFLRLRDQTNTTIKYLGVRLSDASVNLGSTTVSVAGAQTCGLGIGKIFISRCYTITPSNNGTATVRFFYSEAERNGQPASTTPAWRWNGSQWRHASSTETYSQSEGGTTCTTDGGLGCWVQATAVTNFNHPFALGSDAQLIFLPLVVR